MITNKRKYITKRLKNKIRNPTERPEFWLDKSNHFWENDGYSEKGKEICRNFVNTFRLINKKKKQKVI